MRNIRKQALPGIGNFATVVLGVVLVAYIAFLLITNYVSQVTLRKNALVQLKQGLEERSTAVSYFFTERKNDLRNLEESRTVSVFFENKALGMSMEYGLRASLFAISERFHHVVEDKKIGGDAIYTRVILVDRDGEILVNSNPADPEQNIKRTWKHFLAPKKNHEAVIIARHSEMAVSIPYFFKNEYAGQIIAWIAPQSVYAHLIRSDRNQYQFIGICSDTDNFYLPEELPLNVLFSEFSALREMEIGGYRRFEVIEQSGDKVQKVAVKVAVKNTPFTLFTVMSASEVFGHTAPWHVLLAMMALAMVVLGGLFFVWRINTQKMVLQARLEESSKAEKSIQRAYQELKSMQSQLIQSAKLASIGELAAGVAHELNQPLMVIRTTVQFLQLRFETGKPDVDQLKTYFEMVERNTKRMMTIINHLRTFSRQSQPEFSSQDVNMIIEGAFLMIGEQLRLHNIEVQKSLTPNLPKISGDTIRLEQVVLNLLTNARDAIEAKGDKTPGQIDIVTCVSRDDNTWVEILVKDNGTGIAQDYLENIFDPFVTSKEVGKGTGLGLSISYGIAQEHHGNIEVAETSPKGTTFRLRLPVVV